ncbi:MAG: hypothetical protein KJN76_01455, partial [Eudoraea sp.]|nr:hypothetical protein [Eudoraea sp.]
KPLLIFLDNFVKPKFDGTANWMVERILSAVPSEVSYDGQADEGSISLPQSVTTNRNFSTSQCGN